VGLKDWVKGAGQEYVEPFWSALGDAAEITYSGTVAVAGTVSDATVGAATFATGASLFILGKATDIGGGFALNVAQRLKFLSNDTIEGGLIALIESSDVLAAEGDRIMGDSLQETGEHTFARWDGITQTMIISAGDTAHQMNPDYEPWNDVNYVKAMYNLNLDEDQKARAARILAIREPDWLQQASYDTHEDKYGKLIPILDSSHIYFNTVWSEDGELSDFSVKDMTLDYLGLSEDEDLNIAVPAPADDEVDEPNYSGPKIDDPETPVIDVPEFDEDITVTPPDPDLPDIVPPPFPWEAWADLQRGLGLDEAAMLAWALAAGIIPPLLILTGAGLALAADGSIVSIDVGVDIDTVEEEVNEEVSDESDTLVEEEPEPVVEQGVPNIGSQSLEDANLEEDVTPYLKPSDRHFA
jgi:hypothetical protein